MIHRNSRTSWPTFRLLADTRDEVHQHEEWRQPVQKYLQLVLSVPGFASPDASFFAGLFVQWRITLSAH